MSVCSPPNASRACPGRGLVLRKSGRPDLRCGGAGGGGRSKDTMTCPQAAIGPAQLRQALQERPDAGLKFRIVRGCGQEHADAPHPLGLLRARRKRPCGCRASQCEYEFSPSDVDCHATTPAEVVHANRGDDITL